MIEAPNYSYDFEPLLAKTEDHFNRILNHLNILTPFGKLTSIRLNLELTSPEKYAANARRVSEEEGVYKITLSAGLSFYLWTAYSQRDLSQVLP